MSTAFAEGRSIRTETDVAADTCCAILAGGLVEMTPQTIVAMARAAEIPVDAIKRAWHRRQRGYAGPPRGVPLLEAEIEQAQATVHRLNLDRVRAANPLPGMKRCPRCGEVKPYDDFAKASYKSRGYRHSYCRPCSSEYARERRVRGRELGLLQAIRVHLAADSPFIGDECPGCGAGLSAGDEVTAHDVVVGHVGCLATMEATSER